MKNWKTTVCGLVAAVALGAANYTGPNTWQGWLGVVAVAAMGFFAKDHNTTGGTVQQ